MAWKHGLRKAGVKRKPLELIKKRNITCLGHILRGAKYDTQQLIRQRR